MKLHILSDIHLEFGPWPKGVDVNAIDADVTVLAGDIGVGLEGLRWALDIDRPVIYVMGNHEFYGQQPMDELWRAAREMAAGTQIHLLENEPTVIDGVRFLGTTLWTDFCLLGAEQQDQMMRYARQVMTDYNTIHVTTRHALGMEDSSPGHLGRLRKNLLTPRKTLSLHHESRDFLERELAREPDALGIVDTWRKTVAITHHAPSARSLIFQEAWSRIDAAYASNLEGLIEQADLWVHGHTHVVADYQLGAGRVVCNPRGYVGHGAVLDFDPVLVVEV